jgi:LPXTG-motif cell wall-anchored protein
MKTTRFAGFLLILCLFAAASLSADQMPLAAALVEPTGSTLAFAFLGLAMLAGALLVVPKRRR